MTVEVELRRARADRLQHRLIVLGALLGVAMAFFGLVVYTATAPPMRSEWNGRYVLASIIMIVAGTWVACAAWSSQREENRHHGR